MSPNHDLRPPRELLRESAVLLVAYFALVRLVKDVGQHTIAPLVVEALRANRFGGWLPVPPDVTQVDQRAQKQAQLLAENGARLAANAGFEARALWVADERRIPATILDGADELDADLIVTGARGLAGTAAFFGSISNHVLQHASRPVLVVPSIRSEQSIDPLLVGRAGSSTRSRVHTRAREERSPRSRPCRPVPDPTAEGSGLGSMRCATSSAPPPLSLIRFQIQRNRDGKYRWCVFNARGTVIGRHPDGFATESAARRDAEHHRALIGRAPIVGGGE